MNNLILQLKEYLPFPKREASITVHDPLSSSYRPNSIVPRGSVAGTSLTLVVGIMAFLASITLGAVSLIHDTAKGWQNDVSKEVTVQIRPLNGRNLDADVQEVQKIIDNFSGIESATVIDQETMGELLAPWLGNGLDLDELPVPRLITLIVDGTNPPDLIALAKAIKNTVPNATLDDHRVWIDRLTTMANTTILGGVVIFLLMMVATVLNVIFATRGAMASNSHVIEVLHFVGAEQGYIAGQFQRHFMFLGLKGGLVGGMCAIICFLISAFWAQQNIVDPTAQQAIALFGTFSVGFSGYLGTVLLIFIIAILTALTSRYTVFHHIDGLNGTINTEKNH